MLARIDERTAYLCRRVDGMDGKLDGLVDVQADHAERLAKVETRLGVFAGLGAVFSVTAAWLAQLFGRAGA